MAEKKLNGTVIVKYRCNALSQFLNVRWEKIFFSWV